MKDISLVVEKAVFGDSSSSNNRVIADYKKLSKFIHHCKGLGLRVVLTQGTYDMVHIGHARYLEAAKRHGDLLVVGVDSDEKVRVRKGPERPVVPEDERLEILTHLRSVDLVVLKPLKAPKWSLIKLIKPDALVATEDNYSRAQIKELGKHCGKVVVLKRMATTTTSAKLRLLQINTAKKLEQTLTPKLISTLQEVLNQTK
jgi:D-glycero-beta-D-manno-heptose 1-phosphate adenylyltransferase